MCSPYCFDEILAHAMCGCKREFLSRLVERIDGPTTRIGQSAGVSKNGLQESLQLERRVDRLAYTNKRAQLLERLGKFAGSIGDLMFEGGVGLLQPCSHLVEAIGQRLHLVARADFDAMVEITTTDARRAGRQSPDRHNHATCQPDAGKRREQ